MSEGKSCKQISNEKYRENNKEKLKQQAKARRDLRKNSTGYTCDKEYQDKYREQNRERLKNKARQYRRNFPMRIWSAAKIRAKQKGIPFNISPEDIVIPEYCPVLGIPHSVKSDGTIEELEKVLEYMKNGKS